MKKFIENDDFEDYFDSNILHRGYAYYQENRILDIWYQENHVYAYIDGSQIYKVEFEIKNNKIKKYYCSCPYAEGYEYGCKHMAAVLYYLRDNEIPELEKEKNKKPKVAKEKSKLNKIYDKMQSKLKSIGDKTGFINYYNGRYFVDLISDVSFEISEFINDENYDDAFELIKYTYYFIKDAQMDGSNGEYQDSLNDLSYAASRLLYDNNYFEKYLSWASDIAENNELDDFSDAPLYAFILYVHDKPSAQKVVKIIDDCPILYGIFINKVLDAISLIYDYIDKNEAIKRCYENINIYGVKDLLINYLKEDNKIEEIVRILKDDIKNDIRKNIAYNKLIEIYDENNMFEEKKKILPEVIIETNDFNRFKELKNMCNTKEWSILKEEIIPKIKSNDNWILEKIYAEENETDKLFDLIKTNPNLDKLYEYQDILKDKYSKELLDLYKTQIIKEVKWASNRERYRTICLYLKKMNEINNSSSFIYEMLEEIYPFYQNKKAFKEEIMNVLNSENKLKFANLIAKRR